ncbi:MAG: hypothetical protein AAGC91_01140 [Pseudomonadota bacterium]
MTKENPLPRKDALQHISELARSIQELTYVGVQDCNEDSANAAEMLVSIRAIAGVIGYVSERYGAMTFSPDSFLIPPAYLESLLEAESDE